MFGTQGKENSPSDPDALCYVILLLLRGLALQLVRGRLLAGGASVLDGPVVRHAREELVVLHHHLGDLGVLRVFGVRSFKEHAQGEEGGLDGADRRPAAPENIETDGALEMTVCEHDSLSLAVFPLPGFLDCGLTV